MTPPRALGSLAVPDAVRSEIAAQPHPLLFVTVSGAHLYGFPSPDSDWDLRGVHLLPLAEVVGLGPRRETIEHSAVEGGVELDLVTHDAAKFFALLLRRNGYVLEQLTSPLVLHATPAHAELVEIARCCVTRRHSHHYLGFAATQWKLFAKERRVKALLYLYRVLGTGIHMMRTGEVEANLLRLAERFEEEGPRLPQLADLVARKLAGAERERLEDADVAWHEGQYRTLERLLELEAERSALPEAPPTSARAELDSLLVRLRLTGA